MAESYRPPLTPVPSCDLLWGQLTSRQRQVVALIGEGHTNKQIAGALDITDRTVRLHVTAIAYLLGCATDKDARVLIAGWWTRCGSRPAA